MTLEDQHMDDEANAFAIELLVPEEWIRRDAKGIDLLDTLAVEKLAKMYQVSVPLTMLFTRPMETILYAAAGLCAGAFIGLVVFGAKLEAKIRDGERTGSLRRPKASIE